MVSTGLDRDPVYKEKAKRGRGRHLMSIFGLHMHMYGHTSHTYNVCLQKRPLTLKVLTWVISRLNY